MSIPHQPGELQTHTTRVGGSSPLGINVNGGYQSQYSLLFAGQMRHGFFQTLPPLKGRGRDSRIMGLTGLEINGESCVALSWTQLLNRPHRPD